MYRIIHIYMLAVFSPTTLMCHPTRPDYNGFIKKIFPPFETRKK